MPDWMNDKQKALLKVCEGIFGPQCYLEMNMIRETEIFTGCWWIYSSDLDKLRPVVGEIRSIAIEAKSLKIIVTLPQDTNPKQ